MSLEYNDLYPFISASEVQNVACFVMYDEHPKDDKKIDITICSEQGDVREYYREGLVSSITIPSASNFRRIMIVRNSKCDLYYLVEAHDEIIILSRKDNLCVYHRFDFVKKYELCDLDCTGEVVLKIMTENTTNYYSIDKEFENINNINKNTHRDGISLALENKLKEATHILECNKKAYTQILNLRQRAAYFIQNPHDIKIEQPVVKFCNKHIVILLLVRKRDNEMKNVCALIHNNSSNSISYITKYCYIDQEQGNPSTIFFEHTNSTDPNRSNYICSSLIAAVVPLKEFKSSVISKIEFNLVVSYQRQGKHYLQPCENVYVSASEVMGKKFDVLSNITIDENNQIWAILSSTKKTTLYLKQIISNDQFSRNSCIEPHTIFCNEYLGFELLLTQIEMAVHTFSPNHILHGTMIVFNKNKRELVNQCNHFEFNFLIDVYTRSSSQVLALLHFIHDSIPHKLIVITPNIEVTQREFSDSR